MQQAAGMLHQHLQQLEAFRRERDGLALGKQPLLPGVEAKPTELVQIAHRQKFGPISEVIENSFRDSRELAQDVPTCDA